MDGGDRIEITVLGGLGDIAAADWDACAGDGDGRPARRPLHHPPLPARARGRRARSAAAPAGRRATSSPATDGAPIAVMPLYAKGHSQGEYIFDHNWAHAWERAGGRYYPKLQAAVPFTPATGRRFLTRPGHEADGRAALLQGALALAARSPSVSSLHVTFCTADERAWGEAARPPRPHHPAVPLGEPRLRRLRRLPRRPRLAQAQGDPQGARARAGLRRRHRGADRRRPRARALGRLLALLPGHRQPQVGPPLPDPRLLRPGAGDDARRRAAGPRPPPRPLGRRRAQLHRPRHALRPLLGLRSRSTPACTSSSATTRRSTGRSPNGLARVEAGAQGEHKLARGYLPVADPLAALDRRRRLRPRRRAVPRGRDPAVGEEIEVLTAYGPFRHGPAARSRSSRHLRRCRSR